MNRKLLMIEDDNAVGYALGRFLKRKPWDFHLAANGADGLRQAAALRPDVIVLDIQLPDMEGWEVCRRLKGDSELGGIPVVMTSGVVLEPDDRAKGIAGGADDYLVKPFDLTELMLRIEAILKAKGK